MYIGLSAKIGSGKTTVANYLHEKYKFKILRFRDIIIQTIEERGLEKTRKNMQDIGDELYRKLGPESFCDLLLSKTSFNLDYVIDSIRHIEIDKYFRNKFQKEYISLFIEAPIELRFNRLNSREDKIFNQELISEIEDHPVEQEIEKLKRNAEYVILNNKDINYLYEKIDIIMGEIPR